MDLSLLSQLWALNDSIQEFRTLIEQRDVEQEEEDEEDEEEYNEEESREKETKLKQKKSADQVVDIKEQFYAGDETSTLSYESIAPSNVDKKAHHISNENELNTKPTISVITTRSTVTTQPRINPQSLLTATYIKPSSEALTSIETTSAKLKEPIQNAQAFKTISEAVKPVPRMRNAPPPPPNIAVLKRQPATMNKTT